MAETVFDSWKSHNTEVWGRHPVAPQHNLHKHPLFSDEALADLLENYPREDYSLVRPGRQDEAQHALWREGDMGSSSGRQVLDAIRNGFLWINLRNLQNAAGYKELAEQIFEEMQTNVPGLEIGNRGMTLLITSPLAQTYYHLDVPGQSLWQIRGTKRVYLYPASAPFLPEDQLERVVMQEMEEDIPFEPWFDEHARVIDLQPGSMLHWPQFAPHRVENLDMLNISVTTEHWSREITRNYQVRFANGVLRQRFGLNPQSTATCGAGFRAKQLMQAAWRRSGLARRHMWAREINFRLDPAAPGKIADITPYKLQPE